MDENGVATKKRVQYMSPQFLTMIDWCVHKAPFGSRVTYEKLVDVEVVRKFLTECYEQHTSEGAREQLAEGCLFVCVSLSSFAC
jgi:hypothetical protein